ncbi:MAG: anaerobic ribonucleoside-triphosphate reductase activating protein [Ruminococcaceae bacterium]|nr:anaerobic ribonucleoside-triphosphate reductase activating protein [Oscillospiraceae bacterium]
MNYATIKKFDIANGPGVRVSLFVSGCRHHCKNCFNKEAWDFNYGVPMTVQIEEEILDACRADHITGLSLLGGEPFEKENRQGLIRLTKKFRERFPQKTIWCYTGFLLDEELLKSQDSDVLELLNQIDVLVDGRFVDELKSAELLFRGSSNQRIINVAETLSKGEIVLLEGKWERTMGSGDIYEA